MSEDLLQPSVIDLDALLQPIPGDNPSGESLRYSGLYDEISEARRADDNLDQGAWQTELKVANYRRVIELAIPALSTQSKDLQIAAWLSESLVRELGFAGLRDGLRLMSGFQAHFWDSLHPEIDEGDMDGRANAVAWMDTQASFSVKTVPITAGEGLSYIGWEDAQRFNFPDNFDALPYEEQEKYTDLRSQAERENRVTGERWKKAQAATRRQFCEIQNYVLNECWTEFNELNRVIEEKYDRNQMPGLSNLKKALDDTHTQVKKLLEQKRLEEPDETDEAASENGEAGEGRAAAGSGPGGAVQGRRDALKRLGEIAAFFQRTEPHSPVAYLVQRAVKWGNMPLDTWLQDVIKDESVLFQLRQTLGLDTVGADYGSGDYSETAEYPDNTDYQA